MIDYLDFTTPQWLVNYYHSIGILSFFLNFYTFFLLVFISDKIDSLKYYLFSFQFICFLVDIHITLLMQPQPLHPLPAGYCTGVLSGLLSSHTLMTVLMALMATEIGALAMCFLRKFLAFRRMKRVKTSIWLLVSVVLGLVVFIVFIVSNLYFCGLTEDEEYRIINQVILVG
ncbi:hypothetical protein CRE_09435 [Caenorhabditis remanei]|uniref:G-protein coupled receptors family 1 profile domain-containing protein n=1 Tax=Caenorhabditis remanei TaxID=31234 RepID=E3LIU0_CAERE|nr:hypothetical protein CRE_09435 [Caenorhabditis remanei]